MNLTHLVLMGFLNGASSVVPPPSFVEGMPTFTEPARPLTFTEPARDTTFTDGP